MKKGAIWLNFKHNILSRSHSPVQVCFKVFLSIKYHESMKLSAKVRLLIHNPNIASLFVRVKLHILTLSEHSISGTLSARTYLFNPRNTISLG